eukprot:Seg607.5 transcript_id=Seg607.5/GoldUCD/mRNA.D3Y31 product="Marginal zone B- and B1-cell-specific protein" protein_id=Seg607.5/GoldUCD/D3Y31
MDTFLISSLLALQFIASVMTQEGEKMTFSMPKMTEEEQHSQHMPQNLKCDACTAVAFQMAKHLEKAERKIGGKALKESDYLDIFEKVCDWEVYQDYGIKSANGVNRISGEGLEAKDVPGMLGGGGKWPGRLAERCGTLVGEIGEDEIYAEYRKKKSLTNFLCNVSSKDCVKSKKDEL